MPEATYGVIAGSSRKISFAVGKWRGKELEAADWTVGLRRRVFGKSHRLWGPNSLLKISHLCAPAILSLMRA